MTYKLPREDIQDCIYEVIAEFAQQEKHPRPGDITTIVREHLNERIKQINIAEKRRISGYIRIPPRAVAELALAYHHFVWADLTRNHVGIDDEVFLVYMENESGEGIYTDNPRIISKIILSYEDLNDANEKEALKYIQAAAPHEQLDTGRGLIHVKNKIY